MNKVWDLTPLYHGFDDPEFAADMERLREVYDKTHPRA